jgi:hypothetical protein
MSYYLLGEEPHLLLEGELGSVRGLGRAQLLLLLLLQATLPRIPAHHTVRLKGLFDEMNFF